ncbi:hypothetical protein TNCV_4245401 [Trichonephila clavipes]|nr:hypothetical protein TNCV_4245401 [Trichonephila clavipes]
MQGVGKGSIVVEFRQRLKGSRKFFVPLTPIWLNLPLTQKDSHAYEKKGESIDLQVPCFSHVQLYVACSRVGREENLFVHTPNGTVKNVVYRIALR